ncbi:DUF4365 domain-containing protein [Nocardia sp. NBC_00403]|uniref:DUF4365 domain-containing protein n=1 Tax=Nocardia sp. NBC_00403 TaxID=2975990 RepID=UPI002E1D724F
MTDSNGTERLGVYGVGLQIAKLGWIFRIQSESDFGVDAHVEIVADGRATGRLIALQIKSGPAYFREQARGGGWVVRGKKRNMVYWRDHQLPVLLVLHDAGTGCTYWTHINPSGEPVDHQFTPNGFKVVVQETHRLDEDSRDLISSIAERWVPRRNSEWSWLHDRLTGENAAGGLLSPPDALWDAFVTRVAGRASLSAPQLRQSVLVYNLPLIGGSRAAKASSSPMPTRIPLEELRTSWAIQPDTTVFVCENLVVIDSAVRALGEECMPLVHLGGYPNLAVEYLLLALGLCGAKLRVHTDHDSHGAGITRLLFHRLIEYELWCPNPSADQLAEVAPSIRRTVEEDCLPYMLHDLRR